MTDKTIGARDGALDIATAAERARQAAEDVRDVLDPGFFRRLFGGTGSDEARAVVASSIEEAKSVRASVSALVSAASVRAAAEGVEEAQSARERAVAGLGERFINVIDAWVDAATSYRRMEIGGENRLREQAGRMLSIVDDLAITKG